MGSLWIVDRTHGQLGNRCILMSSAYAWCLECGHDLYYPSFTRYADYFPRLANQWIISPTRPSVSSASPRARAMFQDAFTRAFRGASRLGLIRGRYRPRLGGTSGDLPPTDMAVETGRGRYILFSWRFTNPAGLAKYRAQVRELLTPHSSALDHCARVLAALPAGRMRIGVHVRHRDYRTFYGGLFFQTAEQYREHMVAAAARFATRRPLFVVFSDEPRSEREFEGLDVVLAGGNLVEDLTLMSRMEMVIGPVSTFNAFAGYLGAIPVWHTGERAAKYGFEWNYRGLPVVYSLEEAARAIQTRELPAATGGVDRPMNIPEGTLVVGA